MKKVYLPYYLSRALLSAGFALLVFGLTWKAALLALVTFGLFVLYLHSGWFRVDPSNPLFPLRRDERAQQVQRKALVAAACAGGLLYLLLSQVARFTALPLAGGALAIALAILTYFAVQFALHART